MKRIFALVLSIVMLIGVTAYAEPYWGFTKYEFYQNSGMELDDDFIVRGAPENTTGNDIIERIATEGSYVILDPAGFYRDPSEPVTTGTIIMYNGTDNETCKSDVVIKGDCSGDGKLSSQDYLQIKKAFSGQHTFYGLYFDAADINSDGQIKTTDYLLLRKFFAGGPQITPALVPMPEENEITGISPALDEVVHIANDSVRAAGENTVYENSFYDKLNPKKTEIYMPDGVKFTWLSRSKGGTVTYGLTPDLSETKSVSSENNEVVIKDLLAGKTYYFAITSKDAQNAYVSSFTTVEEPRTLFIDGVRNTRDIGGKMTKDGKTIKQGILYRGERTTNITEEGIKQFTKDYGIKTEISLSGGDVAADLESLVNVQKLEILSYNSIFNSEEVYKEHLRDALLLLTDENNFPVYFHCYIGRDRTGTYAALVLALCGVSRNDIMNDYCMSFLSSLGYYSSMTPSGAASNMSSFLGNFGGDLRAGARAFMKNKLGMTDDQLDEIVANCTEAA